MKPMHKTLWKAHAQACASIPKQDHVEPQVLTGWSTTIIDLSHDDGKSVYCELSTDGHKFWCEFRIVIDDSGVLEFSEKFDLPSAAALVHPEFIETAYKFAKQDGAKTLALIESIGRIFQPEA